jgi:hypothetical protein
VSPNRQNSAGIPGPLDDLLAKWSREAVDRRERAEVEAQQLAPAERDEALRRLREAPEDDQPPWRASERGEQ